MKKLIVIVLASLIFVSCASSKKVRIVGIALNSKSSPLIKGRNGEILFLSDTILSDYYINEKIVVRGVIDTIYYQDDTANMGEIARQSISGIRVAGKGIAKPIMRNPKFRRCYFCLVRKNKILKWAYGEDYKER